MQIKTDIHSTHLNDRTICPSFVLIRSVAHCSHIIIIALVEVERWKTVDCVCISEACNLEVKILQGFLCREPGPSFPEFFIFILSESQVSLRSSVEPKKAYVRICYVQVCMHTYRISVQCLNSACACYLLVVIKLIKEGNTFHILWSEMDVEVKNQAICNWRQTWNDLACMCLCLISVQYSSNTVFWCLHISVDTMFKIFHYCIYTFILISIWWYQ